MEDLLSGEHSTDSPAEENTAEPDVATILTKDVEAEVESQALTESSENEKTESEIKSRRKREADGHDDHQHPSGQQSKKQLDSSHLPVEHRGLDFDDHDSSHEHSGATHITPWFSVPLALFVFMGIPRINLHQL